MNADDQVGVIRTERDGNCRTDVLALGAEPRVAQALGHQTRPEVRPIAGGTEARLAWPAGESVARKRRNNHVEAVVLVAAIGARVGQERNDLQELDEGARPAMCEDEWEGIGAEAALVDEVDGLAIELYRELGKAIEPSLLRPQSNEDPQ